MAEWRRFVGRVVRVTTAEEASGAGGEGAGADARASIGMLCAIEPASGHMMLLRLGQPGTGRSEVGDGDSSTVVEEKHTVTLLHPGFVHAVEPIEPMPRAWADFLAQASANGQVSGERLEDTARVNGIGTADEGQDGALFRTEKANDTRDSRPSLEDTMAVLRDNRLDFDVVPRPMQGVNSESAPGASIPQTIAVFGGQLEIRGPPYDAAHCVSANAVILRRMRKLLSSHALS